MKLKDAHRAGKGYAYLHDEHTEGAVEHVQAHLKALGGGR